MKILTHDNNTFELNTLPEEIDDLRYGVLDYSDPHNPDYYFVPLIFLENFYSPAAVLKIGPYQIEMPLDWSIVIGEPDHGDPEVVPIMSLNDRGFKTFCFNPMKSFKPEWLSVDIVNVYQEVRWYFPKLKYGHILALPLTDGPEPLCAYFVKETNKIPEVLDIAKMW